MATSTRTKETSRVQDKLLAALSKVDRPGDVCIAGDWPLTMPGLEVNELGAVRLPLGKTQAKKLIKLCRRLPTGRGPRRSSIPMCGVFGNSTPTSFN